MTDPGIPGIIRELLDRAGTAIALNGLFGLLTGLTAAELVTMFTDYFKGAPVPTIVIRVTALRVGRTPQQMLALLEKPSAALDTQFTTFPARQFPAWTVTYIRAALNIRGWAPAAVVSFLQDNSVKAELKKATREKNPAYWIWLFALHHGGAAPLGGGAPTVVNVAHGTGARVVRLEPWILQHVQHRHTFHHFDFWDPRPWPRTGRRRACSRPASTSLERSPGCWGTPASRRLSGMGARYRSGRWRSG